jgi:micrococcal nuclease
VDGCSQKKNSECTISVRFYGVDAPETPKFGTPGQPFSKEAKDFVSDQIYNKIVRVKLLSKDQYSRAVGSVISTTTTPRNKFIPFLTKKEESDLSLHLMEQGYATLYTGGGAPYNDRREDLIQKMECAKKKRLGVWSIQNDDDVEGKEYVDPATYKRAMKARMNRKVKQSQGI